MARQDALSIILDSKETKDKLAEAGGKLIENIQKNACVFMCGGIGHPYAFIRAYHESRRGREVSF